MFLSIEKNLNKKQLIKRINYKLTSNFYSFEEIQKLNKKQLFKVIKLISKIEKIKLSRKEIKEIVIYLQSNLERVSTIISKLWNFVKLLNVDIDVIIIQIFQLIKEFFYSSYRQNKFELMHE